MKTFYLKGILLALGCCLALPAVLLAADRGEGQVSPGPNPEGESERDLPEYTAIGMERLGQQQRAMRILLGWGSANLIAGGALATQQDYRDFGYMTAGWGIVNAAIAAFSLLGNESYSRETSYETILKDEAFFNRILAINSGLNVAYISVGFAMNNLGDSSRVQQFGTAVMIQGAFLLGFDTWLLVNSSRRLGDLAAYPSNEQVSLPDGSQQLVPGLTARLFF